jgi:uncharacterized protein (TIGR00162 family)
MMNRLTSESETSSEITLRTFSVPSPKDPILICGLPGSGYVGKLGVDHLISVFGADKVLEYYSASFPPHIVVREDGQAKPIRSELYHARTGTKNDLLLFTADAQPTTSRGEYELSDQVLRVARSYGVKTVYSLAAYITGGFSKEPRVFGTSTSSTMREKLAGEGVQVMKEGGITGMNGIMIGLATLYDMDGICLLGETSGYLIDAGAARAILEALSRLLSIKIELSMLTEKAEETRQVIGQIQRMVEQQGEPSQDRRTDTRPGYIG